MQSFISCFTENRKKRERWSLSSLKTSLLQCQVNGGWNMTPEGATRGGTRAPNAQMAECSREKPRWQHNQLITLL